MELPTEKIANTISQVVNVDEQLNADIIDRNIKNQKNILIIKYKSKDAKKLRATIGNLIDNISLTLETIRDFPE